MAATRRPDPRGRTAARSAARASARASARGTAGAIPRPALPQRAGGLTTRAAVLGLVLAALVVSFALPLREYLAQRGEIRRLEQSQAAQRERVAELERARDRLADPAHIAAEARRRLHYVMPGETAYVVLTPEELPGPTDPTAEENGLPAGPEAPWYSQVWGSVTAADRPAPGR